MAPSQQGTVQCLKRCGSLRQTEVVGHHVFRDISFLWWSKISCFYISPSKMRGDLVGGRERGRVSGKVMEYIHECTREDQWRERGDQQGGRGDGKRVG